MKTPLAIVREALEAAVKPLVSELYWLRDSVMRAEATLSELVRPRPVLVAVTLELLVKSPGGLLSSYAVGPAS